MDSRRYFIRVLTPIFDHLPGHIVQQPTQLINLFIYSMEQSRSWEANLFSASQEIPRILCNGKVHYIILYYIILYYIILYYIILYYIILLYFDE